MHWLKVTAMWDFVRDAATQEIPSERCIIIIINDEWFCNCQSKAVLSPSPSTNP